MTKKRRNYKHEPKKDYQQTEDDFIFTKQGALKFKQIFEQVKAEKKHE